MVVCKENDRMVKTVLMAVSVWMILLVNTSTIEAASSHLEFTPAKAYFYDNNTLAVEGTLWNPGNGWNSNEYIPTIAKMDVEIKIQTEQGWKTAKQTLTNVDVGLSGGSYCSRVFYISNIEKVAFTSWEVKTRFY
jgi:hypothetical protein